MPDTPRMFRTHVVRTEQLTPHMVRVIVGGAELALFPDNGCTDRYVKLLFPKDGVPVPSGVEPRSLPPEERPIFRTYTIRRIDAAAQQLTIDFVTHGDEGVAGRWAAAARPGDVLVMTAPGGGYAPRDDVAFHLLVGDESALPAIAAAVEALPTGIPALVLLEVGGPSDEVSLDPHEQVEVRWTYRDPQRPDALLDAVRQVPLPPDGVQAFVHGELLDVRALKRHLLDERSLDPELVSASGYWRRGKNEDGFQAEKRELAQADAAATN